MQESSIQLLQTTIGPTIVFENKSTQINKWLRAATRINRFDMKKKNMNLFGYTIKKIYNSGYSTEIVNEQCNPGDPLESSGGLYRGPPAMLI